jgi:HEAT repeat protein
VVINKATVRYSQESELLQKAITGEIPAAERVAEQLASPYPRIKQKMLEAIHNGLDQRVWLNLLNCLALGRWCEGLSLSIYGDLAAAQRLDISIVEAFLEDWHESEQDSKNAILQSTIRSTDISLRNAAAYLAGLRGDAQALPILGDMLDRGSKRWQLRAIQAISNIPSAHSATLLVKVLVDDHDLYHQEARQGLSKLGHLAGNAWQEALNHADPHIRWHAARGLAEIGDYGGVYLIADGLNNENSTVRWVSSDLLAQIGVIAIPKILDIITRKPLSDECRKSAHHALLSIKSYRAQECLKPLISALSSSSTKMIAQIIAERIQQDWNRLEKYISGSLQSLDNTN